MQPNSVGNGPFRRIGHLTEEISGRDGSASVDAMSVTLRSRQLTSVSAERGDRQPPKMLLKQFGYKNQQSNHCGGSGRDQDSTGGGVLGVLDQRIAVCGHTIRQTLDRRVHALNRNDHSDTQRITARSSETLVGRR